MSDSSNPKERRLVLRLLRLWRDLCGERDLPEAGDLDGTAAEDMWPYCFVVSVAGNKPRFTYFGEWHAKFYGVDMTGRPLSDLAPETLAHCATLYLPEVLQRRVPITYGGALEEAGGRKLLYRSILLPMTDEHGDKIDAAFGGANCRIIREGNVV